MKHLALTSAFLLSNYASAVVIDLDFSKYAPGSQPDQALTGTGTPYDGLVGMFYDDVAVESTSGIAIVARLEATSAYTATNPGINGRIGDDIQVNQTASNGTTSYRLTLYERGTTNLFTNGGSSFDFDLVIYDIDGDNAGLETFTINTPGTFALTDNTRVNYDGQRSFSNDGSGTYDNPVANATDMTEEQERISVILSFTDQSFVDFDYTTAGGGSGGRNFFIDGKDFTVFDDAPSTGINDGTLVPEPSAYTLILGLCAIGFTLARRRPQA